ncbi:MAG: hypothetical protein AAFU79_33090 [Myxococcota bacterium]
MGNDHRPQLRLRDVDEGYALLWLSDEWLEDDLDFLGKHRDEADGAGVSPHQGCRTLTDLSRLTDIGLKALAIPYSDGIDIQAVGDMDTLEYLKLGQNRTLDLRRLRALRHLRATFSKGSCLPESLASLETCSWSACSPESGDLTFMGNVPRLTRLEVVEGSIRSLRGIRHMPLQHLDLYGLHSLWSLEGLGQEVVLLKLEKCAAIPDFSPIGGCLALRSLVLADCGEIPTLRFVHRLPALRRLVLTGNSRVVDGDLHPLLGIPEVHLKDRPWYNLTIEEVRRSSREARARWS